jgi:hypothetical protein
MSGQRLSGVPCALSRKEFHNLDVSVRSEYLFQPIHNPESGRYMAPEGAAVSANVRALTWDDRMPRCNVCGLLIVEHNLESEPRPPREVVILGVRRFPRSQR